MAVFPDPRLHFRDLRELGRLRDVTQLIEEQECYVLNDEGGIDTKYPKLHHCPGEAKTCSVCGLIGHNKKRHLPDLCVVEEAIRHGTSILRNSMIISPRELTRQMMALLASLVMMVRVGAEDPQSVVLHGISKIYTVYNSILHWVTHPSNPQSRYIHRTTSWSERVSVMDVLDTGGVKVVYRTTQNVAFEWIKKVAERSHLKDHEVTFPVTPPETIDKTKTTLVLMTDVEGSIPTRGKSNPRKKAKKKKKDVEEDGDDDDGDDEDDGGGDDDGCGEVGEGRSSALSQQINEFNAISMKNPALQERLERMKSGHRYRCMDKETIYQFEYKRRKKTLDIAGHDPEHRCEDCGAPTDISFVGDLNLIAPFSSCQLCNLIGHNQADCRGTNPGTRICLALATLLDENKMHRIHPTTCRGTLLNVMLLLVSLQYHVMKNPETEEELCAVRLGRGKLGFGFLTDHLVGLLRFYNATVVHLCKRLDLQRTDHFSKVSPGSIMDLYIDSGVREASSVSKKILHMNIAVIPPPSPKKDLVLVTTTPPRASKRKKIASTTTSPAGDTVRTPEPPTSSCRSSSLSSMLLRGAFTNPMSTSMTTFRGVLLSAVAQGNIPASDQRDILSRMATPFLGMNMFDLND